MKDFMRRQEVFEAGNLMGGGEGEY